MARLFHRTKRKQRSKCWLKKDNKTTTGKNKIRGKISDGLEKRREKSPDTASGPVNKLITYQFKYSKLIRANDYNQITNKIEKSGLITLLVRVVLSGPPPGSGVGLIPSLLPRQGPGRRSDCNSTARLLKSDLASKKRISMALSFYDPEISDDNGQF